MPNDHNRLVVLGCGSLSLDLGTRLAATGNLPHLTRLLRHKACAIAAEAPAVPLVNRASLFTAVAPGRHGIYGATYLDPTFYTPQPEEADAIAVPTLPAKLALARKKLVCCGPLFPEENGPEQSAPSLDILGQHLRDELAERRDAVSAAGADWDMLFVDLSGTSPLLRGYYAAALDAAHPDHETVLALLRDWDHTLGAALDAYEALPAPKRLLAVADCGLTACIAEVDCNAWLSSKGLLATTQGEDGGVRILPHKTAAMALADGRIFINIKENFSRGVFHEHVAEDLAAELRDDLLTLTYEGQPVMESVLLARDFGDGELAGQVPNLLCVPRPGFVLTARYDRPDIFGQYDLTGAPTVQGTLFCDSEGAAPATMCDVGALIVRFLELAESEARA